MKIKIDNCTECFAVTCDPECGQYTCNLLEMVLNQNTDWADPHHPGNGINPACPFRTDPKIKVKLNI